MDTLQETLDEEQARLPALLGSLSARAAQPLSVYAIIEHFGRRAFGGAMFLFALLNVLPAPPGTSTVLGFPLLLIAPQLALGGRRPWVPRRVGERTVDGALLRAACRRAIPWLEKLDAVTTRRMVFMFGRPGDALLGLVCTGLAAVLILPIPLGNLLPSIAILILALSLIQRDGALAIVGYLVSGACVGVLIVSWKLLVAAAERLGAWFGL